MATSSEVKAEVLKALNYLYNNYSNYLPLSGGSITGNLSVSGAITGSLSGSCTGNAGTATQLQTARTISLSGDATGSTTFDGSANKDIAVTLANSGVTAGNYNCVSVDAKGRVTQGSSINFVKKINGNEPDSSGNITPSQTGCLPLSGGTMNGSVAFATPDAIKQKTNSSYTTVYGGTGADDGARLMLSGKGDSDAGAFRLYANDGTNSGALEGTPSGFLTWKGHDIEQPLSKGTGYVRYASGIQICWGSLDATSSGVTATFGAAFSDTSYSITATPQIGSLSEAVYLCTNRAKSSVKIITNRSVHVSWIAIGKWK